MKPAKEAPRTRRGTTSSRREDSDERQATQAATIEQLIKRGLLQYGSTIAPGNKGRKARNQAKVIQFRRLSAVAGGAEQWINIDALEWALNQTKISKTEKLVLVTLAYHANKNGETWPSVEHIASIWQMHRLTVRRQIAALIKKRKIKNTGEKRGETGQVRVFRLYFQSGTESDRFNKGKRPQRGHKAVPECTQSGTGMTPNNDNEEVHQVHHGDVHTLGSSLAAAPSKPLKDFVVEGHQSSLKNQPAREHVKWAEYTTWCRSRAGKPIPGSSRDSRYRYHDGVPTEDGFWKWLLGQKPYWQNKVKPRDEIEGYLLDGKFFEAAKANELLASDPDKYVGRFQRAVKRGGNVSIIESHKPT